MSTENTNFEATGFWDRFSKSLRITFSEKMIGIILVAGIITASLTIVNALLAQAAQLSGDPMLVILVMLLVFVIQIVFGFCLSAAILKQLRILENNESALTLQGIFTTAWGLMGLYVAAWRYYWMPLILICVGGLLMFLSTGGYGPSSAMLASTCMLVGSVWLVIRMYSLIFASQAYVRDGLEKEEAIERSIEVTLGKKMWIFWNILGIGAICGICIGIITLLMNSALGVNVENQTVFMKYILDMSPRHIASHFVSGILSAAFGIALASYLYLLFIFVDIKDDVEVLV